MQGRRQSSDPGSVNGLVTKNALKYFIAREKTSVGGRELRSGGARGISAFSCFLLRKGHASVGICAQVLPAYRGVFPSQFGSEKEKETWLMEAEGGHPQGAHK